MRKSFYSTTAINFDASITNPQGGEITLSLSAEITSTLKSGRYMYDVIIEDQTSNAVTRLIEGIVTVLPSVTR